MLPSWVSSWCYQQMLDQTGKGLPGTNSLAYLASSSATKKKSFITLSTGINFFLLSSQVTIGDDFFSNVMTMFSHFRRSIYDFIHQPVDRETYTWCRRYKTVFSSSSNKLERQSQANLFRLYKCLWVRSGAYPRVDHLKVSPFGQTLTMYVNIRLGCKSLPNTCLLGALQITAVKSFITLAPVRGVQCLKTFFFPRH